MRGRQRCYLSELRMNNEVLEASTLIGMMALFRYKEVPRQGHSLWRLRRRHLRSLHLKFYLFFSRGEVRGYGSEDSIRRTVWALVSVSDTLRPGEHALHTAIDSRILP